MLYLCTFFDYRYLDKGLSLHDSLMRQGHPFHLWILCMDTVTQNALTSLALRNVSLVNVDDLARYDKDILVAEGQQIGCGVLLYEQIISLFVYTRHTAPRDLITYLDADIYFFGNPSAISDEMEGYSIGITPHRFPEYLRPSEQYGLYNAGFVSILSTKESISNWPVSNGGEIVVWSGVTIM